MISLDFYFKHALSDSFNYQHKQWKITPLSEIELFILHIKHKNSYLSCCSHRDKIMSPFVTPLPHFTLAVRLLASGSSHLGLWGGGPSISEPRVRWKKEGNPRGVLKVWPLFTSLWPGDLRVTTLMWSCVISSMTKKMNSEVQHSGRAVRGCWRPKSCARPLYHQNQIKLSCAF